MGAELSSEQTNMPDFGARDLLRRANLRVLLAYPIQVSLFVTDFSLLAFARFPTLVSLVMLILLIYLSMFFSGKLIRVEFRNAESQLAETEGTKQKKQ